jgi:hypothetical protein
MTVRRSHEEDRVHRIVNANRVERRLSSVFLVRLVFFVQDLLETVENFFRRSEEATLDSVDVTVGHAEVTGELTLGDRVVLDGRGRVHHFA